MDLSIIIPIYNEEAILETEVSRLMGELEQTFPRLDYEVVLVENGSFDRTREIAQELSRKYAKTRAVYLPQAGYGQALKQGLLETNAKYTALFNIDFWDVPFLQKALMRIEEKKLAMIVGSKTAPGAEDTRPVLRRTITLAFNTILRAVFGFSGTDTHGMKLIRTSAIKPVVAACCTEKEIFDTEFVLRAQAAGLAREEIPVVCVERRKTTYHISKRIPRTIKDLVTLFITFRLSQLHKGRAALAVGSIIFFLAAGLWGFPDSPAPWFDSGVNLGLAKTYVEDGVYSLRLASAHWVTQRPLFISTNYPLIGFIILSFKLFGVGLWQAEIVMFFFLAAFLIVVSLLVRRWYGSRFVPWSLALVATFLPFYGNGLSGGLGEVAGLVYFFAGLLLLDSTNNLWRMVLCGLFFGLAGSTKVLYLLLLPAFGAEEFYRAVKERRLLWRRWFFLCGGLALPLLIWLRTLLPHGLSLSGWRETFVYYANPYDTRGAAGQNLWRFLTESTPIHFALLFTVFVTGLCISAWQNKMDKNHRTNIRYGEIVVLVFALLNIWFYVGTAGWYRYFFPAHLMLLALAPAMITRVAAIERIKQIRLISGVAPVVLSVLVLLQGMHLFSERGKGLYYNPVPRQFAAELNARLGTADVMIFDKPELWFLLKNPRARQYMQMNPRAAFGEDIFATDSLPEYIIGGEPGENYLGKHAVELGLKYTRVDERGSYVVWQKRK